MNDNNILDDITFEDIQRGYFERKNSNTVSESEQSVKDIINYEKKIKHRL